MKCPKCPNTTKFTIEVVHSCGKSIDLGDVEYNQAEMEQEMSDRLIESVHDSGDAAELGPRVMCDECDHDDALVAFGDLPDCLKGIPLYQVGIDE